MFKIKLIYLAIIVLIVTGCEVSSIYYPAAIDDNPSSQAHIRPIETPDYSGDRGVIIFAINHVEEKSLRPVIDRIIRIFAEQEAPVDIEISIPREVKGVDAYAFLVPYSDAGVIDVNLDGSDISWLDADSDNVENAYSELKAELSRDYTIINSLFGTSPAACTMPYERFNEYNYKLLQDSGFSIISSFEKGGYKASRQPVTWVGKVDDKGLYRLPVVAEISYPVLNQSGGSSAGALTQENTEYLESIVGSIKSFGVAVIALDPGSFADMDGKPDDMKIAQLKELIRQSRAHGEIVTFTGWKRYADQYIGIRQTQNRVLPVYNGGPAVIFRLDDVTKGWYEEAVKSLIEVYKNNGVPLDCGVISNAGGSNSFELPWLKKYHDEGSVGISVHGFDWTYYQLDTSKSGLSYEQIRFKLQKARDMYRNYYGVAPVSFTVPTDFYDRDGYNAVRDAGFRIFATQIAVDPHPSTVPVDFDGRKDPHGMYRLPTACDVSIWENEKFADVYDVSKLATVDDYCKYYEALSTTMTDDQFGYMVCSELRMLNVAVISLHPSAFVTDNGKLDQSRIDRVDAIVKWVKTFATVTTFEQWYNFYSIAR